MHRGAVMLEAADPGSGGLRVRVRLPAVTPGSESPPVQGAGHQATT